MGALEALGSGLLRHPRKVVAAWLLATALGAVFALELVDSCRFQFDPVPGTPSYGAQERFHADFPKTLYGDVEVVLISCRGLCASATEVPLAAHAAARLHAKCAELDRKNPGFFTNYTDYFEFSQSAAARVAAIAGSRSPFLSASNRTLMFQLTWQVPPSQQLQIQSMLNDITSLTEELDAEGAKLTDGPSISVALTGPLALFGETLSSTKADIEQKDIFVAPLALVVLLYRIRSWRLLLLPALCLVATVATSFSLFLPFAKYVVDISPLAPTAMAFLAIALSIDYSLFLLTRFVEEVQAGADTEAALKTMLSQSGHVVAVSGCVLVICYLGVLFFPGGGIATVGLGAAFSILICMASNLTLMPCAIASFPAFFTPKIGASPFRCCTFRRRRSASDVSLQPMSAEAQAAEAPSTPFVEVERPRKRRNCWLCIADVVTKPPGSWLVPVLVLGLLVPPVLQVFKYKESFANSLTFPRNGRASDAYARLAAEFPASMLAPTYVLLPTGLKGNTSSEVAAFSADDDSALEAHFDGLCALAGRLLDNLRPEPFGVRPIHLTGLAMLPTPGDSSKLACLRWNASGDLPFSARELLAMDGDIGEAYRDAWRRLMSENRASSMVVLAPPFDPFGEVLRPFVHVARAALPPQPPPSNSAELGAEDVAEPVLMSSLAIVVDILEVAYARFPYILTGTILLVFLVVAIAFRAALAPVKMFFTVVVPLAAVFGVAVWVYQMKGLHFLGIPALTSAEGAGFYWGTPIFTCTIIIGLALDYDIFLFARVVELRQMGFDNEASVRGAIVLTGPIITSAGLIMAIALGGLLLCDVPANNQIGFVMAFGVLVDTFVIRTCLVPAVLTLASGLNYWPQRMPDATKTSRDLGALLCERAAGAGASGPGPSSDREGSGRSVA
mmetsp:Transcript_8175/g.29739  ORF Transcript_8175/g.29739 Transcript_8175/m.29739 type:complete len:902 (-) Transcript_8175:16-2721(-)